MSSWRSAALAAFAGFMVLATAIAVIFQDNITRYRLNPRTPYQTYTPPPPPAYGARGGWVLWPDDASSGMADVFYVHSTTYASSRHWNGPINDPIADATLRRVAAPNQAGPFMKVGAVYGPRYRQATLFATFTHKFDGLAARQLAYGDIVDAFDVFLKERLPERPIILAGYDQGGLYVLGLLKDYFANDETLRANLAAAYVFGHSTPLSLFEGDLQNTPPCHSPRDAGCVVAYIDLEDGFTNEKRRFRQRSLVWTDSQELSTEPRSPLLCVNPISWLVDENLAPADNHLGAASATGMRISDTPPAISGVTDAQCVDGILSVDKPRQTFLRRNHWFGDHWRAQDFNLFYHDIATDAERRINNLMVTNTQENAAIATQVDLKNKAVNNGEE
ncbi:MAG: DUF3089 domain-containing protein [Pseudomonadota bacterium]